MKLHTHRFLRFALWLAFAGGLSACFEPQEGCLDIAATNFDASADKDCCCEYPQLVLSLDQRFGDEIFLNDSIYLGDGGHPFRIKSVAFYLSDFQAFQNGNTLAVSDTLTLQTFAENTNDTLPALFTDDFLLVRRTPIDYAAGTFRPDGAFERVRFRLGLGSTAQRVVPSLAPTSHPLYLQPDSLWASRGAGFVWLQAVVVRDTAAATLPDTLRLTRAEVGDFFVDASGNFQHATGYNFRLTLRADFQKLFAGLNWTTHDIPAWKAQMVANLPAVFSVSQ
jgi:hypothetical protein